MLEYHCPDAANLQRLLLGDALEIELQLFESHLEHCNHCTEAVQRQQPEDDLIRCLASAGPLAASLADNTTLEPLMARLCELATRTDPKPQS